MSKKDFIDDLAATVGLSKNETNNIFDEFVKLMIKSIKKEGVEGFRVANFGIFYLKKRPARKGKNPKTGQPIEIPAQNTITFKLSKTLKEEIN
jgi:DNA-binding protein HU-beta